MIKAGEGEEERRGEGIVIKFILLIKKSYQIHLFGCFKK